MNALSIRIPKVIIIDLFRIEGKSIKEVKGKRTEKDMDMGKTVGLKSSLLLVTKITCHPGCERPEVRGRRGKSHCQG